MFACTHNTSAPMEMHAHVLIWGFKAAYLKQRSSYVQWDKATCMQIISSCPLGSELASVSPATLTMSCHSLRCDASFYIATPFKLLAYAHGCLVATSVLWLAILRVGGQVEGALQHSQMMHRVSHITSQDKHCSPFEHLYGCLKKLQESETILWNDQKGIIVWSFLIMGTMDTDIFFSQPVFSVCFRSKIILLAQNRSFLSFDGSFFFRFFFYCLCAVCYHSDKALNTNDDSIYMLT